MAPSHDLLEALAPDQASLNAAKKLLALKLWPLLERDSTFLWGHCQGSGSTPYRVAYSVPDRGYKCSCPSRKFPCKHVLALMWLRADQEDQFAEGAAPDWIAEWTARRRPKAASDGAEDSAGGDARGGSLAAAGDGGDAARASGPKDPAAAARARERNAKKREASILAGLDELDVWLLDQLQLGGLAFQTRAADACDTISRRLTDAKAPALALRVLKLAREIHGWPEAERSERLLTEFGQLHLIAEAYRRQAQLDAGLRADVRRAVGWVTTREALLKDADAERVEGRWLVGALISELQPDRLRRNETWLVGVSGGNQNRRALLVDHVPAATGAVFAYGAGDVLEAELAFYPSVAPLRAQLRHGGPVAAKSDDREEPDAAVDRSPGSPMGPTLAAALKQLDQERARLPWRSRSSLWARGLQLGFDAEGRPWLHDGSGQRALALTSPEPSELLPLVGLPPWTGLVIQGEEGADLGVALTSMGTWRPT